MASVTKINSAGHSISHSASAINQSTLTQSTKFNRKPSQQVIFNQVVSAKNAHHWLLAERNCLKLLSLNRLDFEVLTFLALTYLKLGQLDDCITRVNHSIQIEPNQADAYAVLGEAYFKQGHLALALSACNQSLHLDTHYFDAWQTKGLTLQAQKKLVLALECFNKSIEINPYDEIAYVNCGNCLNEMEKFEFALAHHNFALELNENCLAALNSKAIALLNLNQFEDALDAINQVLDLAPNLTASLLNRGSIYDAVGKQNNAITDYKKIITLQPDYAMAYCNLANIYLDQRNIEAAKTNYLKAIETGPNNEAIRWNVALFYLLTGDYAQGWSLYETGRHANNSIRAAIRQCPQPMWLGQESIKGKRLLLIHEQGFGDTIQFVRYAALAAELGAKVILELPKQLMSLVETLNQDFKTQNFKMIALNQAFTAFDYHCSMMSLPLAFKTQLGTIPSKIPYLFANQEKVNSLNILKKSPFNIGFAWSGSTLHHNDVNRSIQLAQLTSLFNCDANFHCLQKEIRDADALSLKNLPAIHTYTDQLHDFSDTAALIEHMDLVITVDTAVAHLTGAMGKPVWILLPALPDYRWMLAREDSPWYPTARLFRQDETATWANVISDIALALVAELKKK